ncbi:hypothetical protein AB4097_20855 [Microvirga sp. 2MCAF35]|uniref:hypothetical protein n=1 Tax=Microvirga sp. 2MCAF35 TaxID=3232987 RepID=UPI003F94F954
MARKPEDVKAQNGATPENPVADDVRTKQQLDASEAKREAEAGIDAASRDGKEALAHEKAHPKVHKSQDEEPTQDTAGQPVVEDEP